MWELNHLRCATFIRPAGQQHPATAYLQRAYFFRKFAQKAARDHLMDELPDNESKMKKRNLDAADIWESQTIPLTVVDAKQSPHVQAHLDL